MSNPTNIYFIRCGEFVMIGRGLDLALTTPSVNSGTGANGFSAGNYPGIHHTAANFFVLDTSRPVSVIGVHFKPVGAFPFFALPEDELRNLHVSLQSLWGRLASVRSPHLA
jgi:hypothetical protein